MLEAPLPLDEPKRLRALHALGLLDTPPEERFERIVRMTREVLDVPIALVSLVDAERQWFKARCGLEATETPRRISFCAHAILSSELFLVPDTLADVRFRDNPLVTGAPHARFYAGQPLHAPDGSRVGTLCVLDTQPRRLTDRERRQLADLGAWAEGELHTLTLRQARVALLQQEHFFALAADLLVIADFDGRLHQLSRSWEALQGVPLARLRERGLLELVAPEDRDAVERALARAREAGRQVAFEHRSRGADGAERWLQWSAVPHPGERLLYAVARDVTAQKQLEAERARVQQMKSEFVSTVSHELRTPLTSIRGSLGLLAGGVAGPLPESAQQMVRIAQGNSERLVRLINDILDLEKVERGELSFAPRVVELEALLRHAVEAAEGLAQAAGVRLALRVEAGGVRVHADPDRLLQVLANLLSNAVKFSPEGGEVLARLRCTPQAVRVSVEDRGPGVPEAFRARLFERFAQADSSDTRAKGGTGLGLAISRALVAGMGGWLDYGPREEGGSCFWLELPPWHPEAPGTTVP
ncbi:PAS domain S-box protein [Aggregicoccus sp. 17bor-14]|uniref:GAF domain-containing sensor histidine kinase n=1 Tax=Myxococcaceae TaxID=31 RepID=UPI00129CC3E9|nr:MULTISPECIES: ATP-binding protein [Myxococcaceae]MBF5041560.1 PAS domain S-box protein [Simulacricoccus sp. 17bor-14]MRI87345.1 PAS domain S-box protein [Aggregicoccus sp. 17bor-14]